MDAEEVADTTIVGEEVEVEDVSVAEAEAEDEVFSFLISQAPGV